MPITKSAKKALRASRRRRVFNLRRQRTLNETTKKFKKLTAASNLKDAGGFLPTVYQAIDKAKKRGLLKDNTAARRKSRLAVALSKISKK